MTKTILMDVDLALFDGEGGASASTGDMGDSSTTPVGTQPEQTADTRADGEGEKPKLTLEERRKAYNDLIRGEYKDFYTEDTQRMIDRRFRESKEMERKLQEHQDIMDMLMVRYGVEDASELQQALEDDDTYWEQAAMDAGMSVDQYKQFSKLERENRALINAQKQRVAQQRANAQIETWYKDAEVLKKTYPDFDLKTESANPDFMSLLQHGLPMDHAYKVIHLDDIISRSVASASAEAEQKTVDNIRARGQRPSENGVSPQSSFTTKTNVAALTKAERAEIAKRVAKGEIISF